MPKERRDTPDVESPSDFDKVKTRRDWCLTVHGEAETLPSKL